MSSIAKILRIWLNSALISLKVRAVHLFLRLFCINGVCKR
nr:MAG TPA: hypothetical protein [Microviridae sp.]